MLDLHNLAEKAGIIAEVAEGVIRRKSFSVEEALWLRGMIDDECDRAGVWPTLRREAAERVVSIADAITETALCVHAMPAGQSLEPVRRRLVRELVEMVHDLERSAALMVILSPQPPPPSRSTSRRKKSSAVKPRRRGTA